MHTPELSFSERRGLFRRLLDFEDLKLDLEKFSFFSGLFQGFPDQIRFASDLILDMGVSSAYRESHQITEYNSDKASAILSKYSDNKKILEFLSLLSRFEFISFDFLFTVVRKKIMLQY